MIDQGAKEFWAGIISLLISTVAFIVMIKTKEVSQDDGTRTGRNKDLPNDTNTGLEDWKVQERETKTENF